MNVVEVNGSGLFFDELISFYNETQILQFAPGLWHRRDLGVFKQKKDSPYYRLLLAAR